MDKQYDIIICDLDGTLARSKQAIEQDMADMISRVLSSGRAFGVITGGIKSQVFNQVVNQLPGHTPLERLYAMPTSGAQMYHYDGNNWQASFPPMMLAEEEKEQIRDAFSQVMAMNLVEEPVELWGEQLEDREAQMSWSALGQQAPVEKKEQWDPDRNKRKKMVAQLAPLIPGFHVKFGGSTTIDITQEGVDKEFGINKFFEVTGLDKQDCLFIGDAIEPGGNDYAATKTGVDCMGTLGPSQTLEILARQR